MAIQLKAISKRKDNLYIVTVEDTSQVVGLDESGGNVYRAYSVKYNPANGRDALRDNIEQLIRAEKIKESDVSAIETDVKTTIESIDPTQIQVRTI